jgi:hypothetical protein
MGMASGMHGIQPKSSMALLAATVLPSAHAAVASFHLHALEVVEAVHFTEYSCGFPLRKLRF